MTREAGRPGTRDAKAATASSDAARLIPVSPATAGGHYGDKRRSVRKAAPPFASSSVSLLIDLGWVEARHPRRPLLSDSTSGCADNDRERPGSRAIAEGFGNMRRRELGDILEVCNRARDFQDAMIATR